MSDKSESCNRLKQNEIQLETVNPAANVQLKIQNLVFRFKYFTPN